MAACRAAVHCLQHIAALQLAGVALALYHDAPEANSVCLIQRGRMERLLAGVGGVPSREGDHLQHEQT